MAEWFKRSTVNTFYKGSSPFKSLKKINFELKIESFYCYLAFFKLNILLI